MVHGNESSGEPGPVHPDPASLPNPAGGISLRVLLMLMLAAVALYVGLFCAILVFRIAPTVHRMKQHSHTAVAAWVTRNELDSTLQRSTHQIRSMVLAQADGNAPSSAELDEVMATLRKYAEHTWVGTASRALTSSPLELRVELARAMGAESGAINAVLDAATELEQGRVMESLRQLQRGDSLRHLAATHLLAIEVPALMAAFQGERDVADLADAARELVWWWAGVGAGLSLVFLVVVHRRLYRPLAELERGLARVSAGDLSVVVPVRHRDELGRVTWHLNRATAVLRDRTAEERRRGMERAAREWSMTFDAIADPIMIVGASGDLVRVNEAARVLAGRDHDSILGKAVAAVSPDPLWQRADVLAAEVRATGRQTSTQIGSPRWRRTWDLEGMPVIRDGELQAAIIVAHDITALNQLQDSLRRSETMAAMGSLVAGVAHEVRNPLFSMTATLDAFEARHRDRPRDEPHLEILRNQLGRLQQLMRDLLEYGKPSSLELTRVDLAEVVRQAAEASGATAQEFGVRVSIVADPDLPAPEGDKLRLVQVFCNLIINGMQHAPRDSVVLVAVHGLHQDGRHWLEVTVADNGPGFVPDALPHVFEPFYTRRRGGTGLGLALVQRIVEQHGGTVGAENRPSGGGLVRVRLPLARS